MAGPSIAQLLTKRPDLFAFEVRGRIRETDIAAMAHTLETAFDRLGTVDILIVMRHWDGIDMSAAFDGAALKAQARAAAHVGKYAVVGAPAWAKAMINLFSPLTPVEEKTFELAEEEQAWAWVGGQPAAKDRGAA
jgi:hypothetical protein